MIRDAHGLEMTAAAPAVAEGYDRALRELLHYGPDMLSAPQDVLAEDPDCPMGNLLRAYQSLMAAEVGCLGEGRDLLGAFKARVLEERLVPRERAHVRVAEALAREDLLAAAKLLRELNREYPRDALGLYLGHNLDYFTGDACALRDRIAEALPAWSANDALYAPVLGMYAFGLEEMGDYDGAEEVGGEALSLDPKDVWGLHAVVHTYEMRARFGEGLELFDRRMGDWAEGNYFTVHNWWHYALFNLEAGNLDAVRRIYDERLFLDPGKCVAVKMCDASALLWRLLLDGVDEPERWRELARVWAALVGPPCYAFNDMHAVMAFVGNGDVDRADGLIADRKRWLAEDHAGVTNYSMTANVGLPVCQALLAFGTGRYGDAVDQLMPIRHQLNEFGGSHAQRDAVLRTLLEAAIRGRRYDVAELVLGERITVKPGSPYNWLKRGELARASGNEDEAAGAEARAEALVRASGLAA